jgi:signal transduction histidine kinase
MSNTMASTIGIAKGALKRLKSFMSETIANDPSPQQSTRKSCRVHLIVIIILLALLTFIYYLDQTPLVKIPLVAQSFLVGIHDWQRTLFLIPMIYAAVTFRIRGSIITSLGFLCVILPRAFLFSPYPNALLRPLIFFIVSTFVSLLVAFELNRVDKEKEHKKIDQFLADTLSAQEKEKRYLAGELHDDSLQSLVDISHEIDELSETKKDETIKTGLAKLRGEVDRVGMQLRHFITGLRPPLLDEIGLDASLRWLAQTITEESGIQVHVVIQGAVNELDTMAQLQIFRIAQEALQNVRKHSRASNVDIRLFFAYTQLELSIKDNGMGCSLPTWEALAAKGKFGLVEMTERVRLLGGKMRIESSPGYGTSISVEIPLKKEKMTID